MEIQLKQKHGLVCGSTRGIGKAVALELAAQGATVTLVGRNAAALAAVVQELPRGAGQTHRFIVADFSQPETLAEQVRDLLKTQAPVHILVNNTGGPPAGPAIEAAAEEYLRAFTQHLICNQLLAQAVVPGMKAAGYGRIINIISTSVKQPIPGLGVSNTVRGAVANWAKTLAGELGPFGITVNNVLPGATETQRLHEIIADRARVQGKTVAEVGEAWRRSIPAGRFAQPAELAYAVAFLASPAAAYINGINLPVDGGRTACL